MCVDSHNNITTEQLYARFLKVDSIVTDSRLVLSEVAKGKKVMFFCLKGDSFDANDFIDEVLESGAAYIVSDREGVVGSEKILKTANTLTALQSMANHHRRGMRAQVIALTGSNGKTTTKELMNVVLSKKYNVLSTKGNLNNHIGVPLTLLSVTDKHDIAIIEQGANHKGEIAALCAISEPDYGLITNIGKAHLEGFGGEDGIIEGKGEMFDFLLNNGSVAFYNSSLPHLSDMIAKRVGLRSVAYNSSLITTNHLSSIDGISFIYKDQNVTTHLTGEYNLYNVLTAIAVGCYFDVEDADIISAISSYIPHNMRSQLMETSVNRVIVDAYNANPSSMSEALKNFNRHAATKRCYILGQMNELGSYSAKEHAAVVSEVESVMVKNRYAVAIYVGKEFRGLSSSSKAIWFETAAQAHEHLKIHKLSGYDILLKGSRGVELEKLLDLL